jgi:hypothetical protein
MDHLGSYLFGLYDMVFGYYTRLISIEAVRIIDKMNAKRNPDRVIGQDIHKITTLNQYCEKIIVKLEGFRNV